MGAGVAVAGIGSVSIPVKKSSSQTGSQAHSTLTIDNVLHAPGIVSNILGQGFMDRYQIDMSGIWNHEGSKVACWNEKKDIYCLKLSGPPVGPVTAPSILLKSRQDNKAYYINARWPESERKPILHVSRCNFTGLCFSGARWENAKPYTDAERAWLKQHFQDKFHFLRMYGLFIHKDEDREEGKRTLRSFMADEDPDGHREGQDDEYLGSQSEIDDEDKEDSSLNELEDDPMSHMADYHFSTRSLIGSRSITGILLISCGPMG